MNEQSKPWYQSKTIIGALVTGAAAVAATFGLEIGPEGQEQITTGLVGIIGAVVVVIGRVKAKDKIKGG